MSTQEAFKALAKAAGPWISRWRPWRRDEKRLIHDLDNLTAVSALAWKARTKYGTLWLCIAWVSVSFHFKYSPRLRLTLDFAPSWFLGRRRVRLFL